MLISQFCVVLPARTPRQLMTVSMRSAIAASHAAAVSLVWAPTMAKRYFANVTATAAIPPLWITSSSAQP